MCASESRRLKLEDATGVDEIGVDRQKDWREINGLITSLIWIIPLHTLPFTQIISPAQPCITFLWKGQGQICLPTDTDSPL